MNDNSNIKNSNDNKKSKQPKTEKYIVPPGLHMTYYSFLALCKVAEKHPIIVVGGTGVGKSMFLHIFKKLYEDSCAQEKTEPNVVWANCADFDTDPNNKSLARSELFGYVGGAYTGAKKGGMDGLIHKAHKGLLILEEIGELPRSVQAMLLRFIETGEYSKVGSPKTEKAEVQVIGATNNEEAFRDDFRYRFLLFYVPALYERRQDVLYYIAAEFPELIATLTSTEIMILLAFNWPGNVREVNHVVTLMLRNENLINDVAKKLGRLHADNLTDSDQGIADRNRLSFYDEHYSAFRKYKPYDAIKWAAFWGGDKFLLSQMHKLGFRIEKEDDMPFDVSNKGGDSNTFNAASIPDIDDDTRALSESLGVKILPKTNAFDRAYRCYTMFCGMLGKKHELNVNILPEIKNGSILNFRWDNLDIDSIHNIILKKTVGEIPEGLREYLSLFSNRKNPKYKKSPPDYTGKSQEDVLKEYYNFILIQTGGNKPKAAVLAKVKYQTLLLRLKKLGLSRSSKKKNKKIKSKVI
jgi:transcriptional regulator with PAS, ATPase and Fis domain